MAQGWRVHGHRVWCVYVVCWCLPLGHDAVHQGEFCARVFGVGRYCSVFGADFGRFLFFLFRAPARIVVFAYNSLLIVVVVVVVV